MIRFLAVVGVAMLGSGSGCCFFGACPPGGYPLGSAPIMASGCDSCGGTCTGACGADTVFPGTCGTCVGGSCGGLSGLVAPLLSTRLACGSGCGGVYWNEWICDPPDCCDPCNDCGCWVGPRCDGYAYPYGSGILSGGPIGLVHGVMRGATNVVGGILHSGFYGYPGGYVTGGHVAGGACGCADCSGGAVVGGCDSCGVSGCSGGCAATSLGNAAGIAQQLPAQHVQMASGQAAVGSGTVIQGKSPHRLVTKRLRR